MLSMLGNRCIVIDVGGEWNELFAAGIEELSLVAVVSCTLSVVSNVCSFEDTGEGTKNFGLAPLAGLTDGTEGDWNKFVGFPPPLLKVSTYLQKYHMQKCLTKCGYRKEPENKLPIWKGQLADPKSNRATADGICYPTSE